MSNEAMKLALKRAFQLGQDYWYQADHESYSQNKKSDATRAKFEQLVDDTCEALAKQEQGEPDYKTLAIQLQQQRTWVGLTDREKSNLWLESRAAIPRFHTYASLVEEKLKEKNT